MRMARTLGAISYRYGR